MCKKGHKSESRGRAQNILIVLDSQHQNWKD